LNLAILHQIMQNINYYFKLLTNFNTKIFAIQKSSDRYCMASFCTGTCSVIGAFTEAGMIQLAGTLLADFLTLAQIQARNQHWHFFLGLLGLSFLLEIAKKIVIEQRKIGEEQRMIVQAIFFETSAQFQSQNPQKISQEIFLLIPGQPASHLHNWDLQKGNV